MTPTHVCKMMNKVYETLKPMTIDQIKEASLMAPLKMPLNQAVLYQHQCKFTIWKKQQGKW